MPWKGSGSFSAFAYGLPSIPRSGEAHRAYNPRLRPRETAT